MSREADALVGLPGLEAVERQLGDVIAVLRVEQRRTAGLAVKRPVWKNLVFAGAPGSGKSRTAAAVGCFYEELGLLSSGHLDEVSAMDLVGENRSETSALVAGAAKRSTGCVLMINDVHAWLGLSDRGQHVMWELYEKLTEYRKEMRDDLAVILAVSQNPLRRLLYAAPPLAARFRAVIDFPGYTPGQLAEIFGTLADEAGLSLTQEAESKAAALLAQAEAAHASGNARLAVRLLHQVISAQAPCVAAPPEAQHPATLSTVVEADIPEHLDRGEPLAEGDWSGQYL
jgi:SpoVK/Ycf46/Vps4 family AAA+-type ATPase